MSHIRLTLGAAGFLLAICLAFALCFLVAQGHMLAKGQDRQDEQSTIYRLPPQGSFDVEVLVNGRPLTEYFARGRTYVEATNGAEYELRVRNSSPYRVAVALSVDGLNTIDARHTSAWNSSKWVIEPYQSITIGGWQMSTERARRFYFTNERDSYGAKLGQTANLGVISAVIFRERQRAISVYPPPPYYPQPSERTQRQDAPASSESRAGQDSKNKGAVAPMPDDEYAATGIGRSVRNDVRWVDMDLESQPVAQMSIRYEYYSVLLKLGVVPRPNYQPYPLGRREDARGFSPEP
jgi:hypothetical protein